MCKWTDEQLKEFDGARNKMVMTLGKYLDSLSDGVEFDFYIQNRHLRHVMIKVIRDEIRLLSSLFVEELSLGFIKSHNRKVEEITLALACVSSMQQKADAYDYYGVECAGEWGCF